MMLTIVPMLLYIPLGLNLYTYLQAKKLNLSAERRHHQQPARQHASRLPVSRRQPCRDARPRCD